MDRVTWRDLHGDQGDLGRDARQAEAEQTAKEEYGELYDWFPDLLEVEQVATEYFCGFRLKRTDTNKTISEWDW